MLEKSRRKTNTNKVPRIFSIINKITPIVDIITLFTIAQNYPTEQGNIVILLCYAGIGYVVYRWAKAFYMVFKSKTDAYFYLLDNRVIPICGKQRVGKSSLACYFANVNIGKVYSNIPLRLKGKFTNHLTTEILTCREQVDDYSLFLVDEASLFYNNVKSDDTNGVIYGQAVVCQCVGHFFDGNILYVSVDTSRIPKPIRDNYSATLQVIGSECYKYSFIGDFLLNILAKSFYRNKRIFTGLRIWKAQHYETIKGEQYVSLLGQDQKTNIFSPVYRFASFQSFGLDEYDDRYMKAYYKTKRKHVDTQWDSLQISQEDFKNLYDSVLFNYLNRIDVECSKKDMMD